MRMSHSIAIKAPPPKQKPRMAAIVGLTQARTTAEAPTRGEAVDPSSAAICSAMSPPAEKARSPAPVMTIAPMSSSASSCCNACSRRSTRWELSALSFSGRFNVTSPTRPRRSSRIGSICSDDSFAVEAGDVIGAIAELQEDLVRVLPVLRRRPRDFRRRALHLHAWGEQPLVSEHRVVHFGDDRQRLHLLVGKTLFDVQHRSGRHTCLRQHLYPFGGRATG